MCKYKKYYEAMVEDTGLQVIEIQQEDGTITYETIDPGLGF